MKGVISIVATLLLDAGALRQRVHRCTFRVRPLLSEGSTDSV